MKKQLYLSIPFLLFFIVSGFSQVKDKKELKEERRQEAEREVAELIDSRTYAFMAKTAMPLALAPMALSPGGPGMVFSPDRIVCTLPFFGKVYDSEKTADDTGMIFSGAPVDYKVKKRKKSYEVSMEVTDENDTYSISLSVNIEGVTTVTISSVNRSDISYSGNLAIIKKD